MRARHASYSRSSLKYKCVPPAPVVHPVSKLSHDEGPTENPQVSVVGMHDAIRPEGTTRARPLPFSGVDQGAEVGLVG